MNTITASAIPDYSEQAAVELRGKSKLWRANAQRLIDALADDSPLQTLLSLSKRLTKTLRLLGYQSVSFGLDEVIELLHHWLETPPSDKNEAALVLLQVAEELQSAVALPASQARKLSALGWLPVIDNCRACRHVPALSKDVVAAAGIALASPSSKPMPTRSDCDDFFATVRAVQKLFARQLIGWYREPSVTTSLAGSNKKFQRLANECRTPSRLSSLEPLFCAAGVVLDNLVNDSTRSNIAVQRLFGRLERYLAKLGRMDFDTLSRVSNLLPDDILRQLLFYVAEYPNGSSHAQKLRTDYGLHVLATAAQCSEGQSPPTAELCEQVLAQIRTELDELQLWLSQPAADPEHKRAKQLFTRLDEQYIAVSLLDLGDLAGSIDELRQGLLRLKLPITEALRLTVAEQLLRVRESLDTPIQRGEIEPGGGDSTSSTVDDVAVRLRQLSRRGDKNQFQTAATVACLHSVQDDLRRAETEVLALLDGSPLINASSNDIAQRLERAAVTVTVIPLPEVRPLLEGLATALKTKIGPDASDQYLAHFAELLVALDMYLDSVISDSQSLTPMLQHAVEALQALDVHPAANHLATIESELPKPAVDAANVNSATNTVLDAYLAANRQITPWINHETDDHKKVESALLKLCDAVQRVGQDSSQGASVGCGGGELASLVADCARYVQQSPVPDDARDLVTETMSVVPQMLHAEPGVADSVRGIDVLKQRLLSRDATQAHLDSTFDSTLHNVFVRECASHIDTLRNAISVARADVAMSKLPSEKMLRALHTLSGCAQTVDAGGIVAIVQPLQKAALGLQRSGKYFTKTEIDFIELLSDTMEAHLHNFQNEGPIEPSVLETQNKLPEFVDTVLARTLPETADVKPTGNVSPWVLTQSRSVEPNSAGLASIFRAEADDLMLSLRAHGAVLLDTDNQTLNDDKTSARDGALKVLHTIKGSARMAGNHAMADVAHGLESDVASINDPIEFGENIRQNLPRLQEALTSSEYTDISLQDDAEQHTSLADTDVLPPDTVPLPLSEQSLGTLLETGTILVSRQVQVDDKIVLLREHIRDIQASSDRLQRLAQDNPAFESVAARELVADIQAARRQFEVSVHELQHSHGLASHAGAALHRSLVQSRLRTVESLLPRLQAALSDASTVCNREANLMLTGGDIRVSADTLKSLAPLLEQLIRNSIAHGMHTASVREAEHKPADGEVAISVRIDGTDLLIEVSDDGDGVDEDALNQKRHEEGLGPVRNKQHLREILCTPGYSTNEGATPVAGRGQGLGMVLDGVEALGGELDLINEPGEGLNVRLRVPQKMVVMQSLVFGEGVSLHAIPINYVTNVVDYDGESDEIEDQNQSWTVSSVEQLMGVPVSPSQTEVAERCALVTVSDECIAIPLPALDGYRELLVQPLGAQLESLERYVGGALLSDGRQALILNLHRLMQTRGTKSDAFPLNAGKASRAEPLAALIADDSVTMRVAGERLLQRLGFQVHTARDGLEALDFLTRSLPAVLLLDIEMPGADGFDVVRRMRPELVAAQVPVIMISTRRGPQERDRARSLGVRHLIHKPYTETQLREALEEVGVLAQVETET